MSRVLPGILMALRDAESHELSIPDQIHAVRQLTAHAEEAAVRGEFRQVLFCTRNTCMSGHMGAVCFILSYQY